MRILVILMVTLHIVIHSNTLLYISIEQDQVLKKRLHKYLKIIVNTNYVELFYTLGASTEIKPRLEYI